MSNPKNGILTSHDNHIYVLHDGSYKNVTDYNLAISLDPSIKETVDNIYKVIYQGGK